MLSTHWVFYFASLIKALNESCESAPHFLTRTKGMRAFTLLLACRSNENVASVLYVHRGASQTRAAYVRSITIQILRAVVDEPVDDTAHRGRGAEEVGARTMLEKRDKNILGIFVWKIADRP